MSGRKETVLDLPKFVDTGVQVKLTGGRQVIGTLGKERIIHCSYKSTAKAYKSERNISWQPPPLHYYKFNFDGSADQEGNMGSATVMCASDGSFTWAGVLPGKGGNALIATEAVGVWLSLLTMKFLMQSCHFLLKLILVATPAVWYALFKEQKSACSI